MRFRVLARKSTTSLSGWVRDTHEHPGLRHPLWWVALFVLLANDHVLKQAGALPPVLTGKLSDFAGLIVAPVLLAALVRARSTRPVAICFAATAVVFAAINLDSACAVAMERVTASLGVGWTIYPDPTDLIALTVLPVAWSTARTAPRQTRRTWERWVERAALGLGLLACIATSKNGGGMRGQDWTEWTASTYVVNNTDEVVDLRVRWFTGQLDCDAVQTRLSRALAPDVFDEGIHFSLQPHHSVPIGRSFALDAAGIDGDLDFDRPDDRPGNDCHAALLQAEGMPDYIAFCRAREVGITTFTEVSPAIKRGRLELAGPATARHITPFLGVMVEPARRHIEPPRGCAPVTPAVSWSLVPSSWRYFRIETIDNLPDGCLDIALTPVHGPFEPDVPLPNPRRFSACIPANRFPFGPGDEVEMRADERLDIRHEFRLRHRARMGNGLREYMPKSDAGSGAARPARKGRAPV